MHRNTKVATCCYCGTRAALVLDVGRHELVCSGCGAPLHNLKALPVPAETAQARAPAHARLPQRRPEAEAYRRPEKPLKKQKPRKSKARRLFSEAWDLLEDIFD